MKEKLVKTKKIVAAKKRPEIGLSFDNSAILNKFQLLKIQFEESEKLR
jgi:hypothetical protein